MASHNLGWILRGPQANVAPVLREVGRAEDLWMRRSAILCQLRSKTDTDTALLHNVLTENLAGSPYGAEAARRPLRRAAA